jgi:hypothetical protein
MWASRRLIGRLRARSGQESSAEIATLVSAALRELQERRRRHARRPLVVPSGRLENPSGDARLSSVASVSRWLRRRSRGAGSEPGARDRGTHACVGRSTHRAVCLTPRQTFARPSSEGQMMHRERVGAACRRRRGTGSQGPQRRQRARHLSRRLSLRDRRPAVIALAGARHWSGRSWAGRGGGAEGAPPPPTCVRRARAPAASPSRV